MFVVIGYAASTSLSGCAATAKSGFDDDAGTGDDGGVSGPHDGGKKDGSSSGGDSGSTGNDSGSTGGGDCTAFCMKESMVTGCPAQAQCETNCQNSTNQVPANCMSQWSAVLQCASTTGTISSCNSMGQAQISGCTSQIQALTTCVQGGTGNDGGTMMSCGLQSSKPACNTCLVQNCCSQAQACANSSECIALLNCINACAMGDTACENNCGTQHQSGVAPYNAVGMCMQSNCTTACM